MTALTFPRSGLGELAHGLTSSILEHNGVEIPEAIGGFFGGQTVEWPVLQAKIGGNNKSAQSPGPETTSKVIWKITRTSLHSASALRDIHALRSFLSSAAASGSWCGPRLGNDHPSHAKGPLISDFKRRILWIRCYEEPTVLLRPRSGGAQVFLFADYLIFPANFVQNRFSRLPGL